MILSIGTKRWMTLSMIVLMTSIFIGCQRDHNPLLATPAPGANQLTLTFINFDTSQAPEIHMTFSVATDMGAVTDLLLGNMAILVDSKPEIPIKLIQDPNIPGRYTFVYRSRSTNSTSPEGTWHGLYIDYGDLPVTYINP